MSSNRKTTIMIVVMAVMLMAIAALAAIQPSHPATAAPAAAVTPAAGIIDHGGSARLLTFFDAVAITTDTRRCLDTPDHDVMDVQYLVDVGTVNTTTLTIQNTNIEPTESDVVYNSGAAIASAVVADGNGMSQQPLFGMWNCIYADVTNTNPITITVIGVAK